MQGVGPGDQAMTSQQHPNHAKADAYGARFKAEGISHLINGESVPSSSGNTFENITPIDNTPLCRVAQGDASDIDAAAQAAKAAFPAWRKTSAVERKRLIHAVADLIEEHAEEIALLETYDTGQTIKFMSKAAERAAGNFRFFADRAESAQDGLALPTDGHLNYTIRQPIGPVGIITPWNTPFMLSTWKIAPALAAGCTIVHKPAEWSPITAMRLAEHIHKAGMPPGTGGAGADKTVVAADPVPGAGANGAAADIPPDAASGTDAIFTPAGEPATNMFASAVWLMMASPRHRREWRPRRSRHAALRPAAQAREMALGQAADPAAPQSVDGGKFLPHVLWQGTAGRSYPRLQRLADPLCGAYLQRLHLHRPCHHIDPLRYLQRGDRRHRRPQGPLARRRQ